MEYKQFLSKYNTMANFLPVFVAETDEELVDHVSTKIGRKVSLGEALFLTGTLAEIHKSLKFMVDDSDYIDEFLSDKHKEYEKLQLDSNFMRTAFEYILYETDLNKYQNNVKNEIDLKILRNSAFYDLGLWSFEKESDLIKKVYLEVEKNFLNN